MTEPDELETLLVPIRANFHAKRRDVVTTCDELSSLLAQYRHSVDNAIVRELAKSHGLQAPAPASDSRRLALELLDKVRSLPELKTLLVPDEPTQSAPSPIVATASSRPSASSETNWPLLRQSLSEHPLVIVGGPPHLERIAGLKLNPDVQVEWVDTTRQGTHAIGNLERRIKDKRVSALLILEGLVQHRHSDPLVSGARRAEIPLGYGGKGGRSALSHALDELEKMLEQRGVAASTA